MYVIIMLLALGINALHGRKQRHEAEYLAGAVDQAVAGVAGGFTDERRATAERMTERGSAAVGAPETRALLAAIPKDPYELADPLRAARDLKRWFFDRVLRLRAVRIVAIVLLVVESAYVVQGLGIELYERWLLGYSVDAGSASTVGLVLGTVAAVISGVLVVIGLIRLGPDPAAGFGFFHHALLVSLLLTRGFQFEIQQFVTVLFVLLDLALLAVVSGERAHLRRRS
jgi:hypothetical protein